MRRFRLSPLLVALSLTFSPAGATSHSKPQEGSQAASATLNVIQAGSEAVAQAGSYAEARLRAEWVNAVTSAREREQQAIVIDGIPTGPDTVGDHVEAVRPASGNCGGDLPPCWVMERESGGDPNAYNPTGCNGYGCYGKWQFSGAWACHFDLSCDIASWTEAEQDYAAVQLYDGGRGCSHWDCC